MGWPASSRTAARWAATRRQQLGKRTIPAWGSRTYRLWPTREPATPGRGRLGCRLLVAAPYTVSERTTKTSRASARRRGFGKKRALAVLFGPSLGSPRRVREVLVSRPSSASGGGERLCRRAAVRDSRGSHRPRPRSRRPAPRRRSARPRGRRMPGSRPPRANRARSAPASIRATSSGVEPDDTVEPQHMGHEVVGEHRQPVEVAEARTRRAVQIRGRDLGALEERKLYGPSYVELSAKHSHSASVSTSRTAEASAASTTGQNDRRDAPSGSGPRSRSDSRTGHQLVAPAPDPSAPPARPARSPELGGRPRPRLVEAPPHPCRDRSVPGPLRAACGASETSRTRN